MSAIHKNLSRREFLRRFATISAVAGSPFAASLYSMGAAAAVPATDYKSLVCVFLFGGNDNANTVVPLSSGAYSDYASARLSVALSQSSDPALNQLFNTLNPIGFSGPSLALNPALTNLRARFNGTATTASPANASRNCAMIANVGTLVVPTSKAQWNDGRPIVRVPQQLFSHSDQQGAWQTGLPDTPSTTGILGRLGDVMVSSNNSNVSICMSVAGNALMMTGDATVQYQITPQGPVRIAGLDNFYGSVAGRNALRTLLTRARNQNEAHRFERQLAGINARAIDSEIIVNSAITPVTINTPFPAENGLASQLRMVARLIAAREMLGQRRQVFFVSAGGHDFHDNLLVDQSLRLSALDSALDSFYAATEELGVSNTVTTFTASDFGRALLTNGRGSDHGWGSHHFVMGGAVNGGRIFGTWPTVALRSADDAGEGRLIPTTSVDQYVAALARWFGATSAADLAMVLPNVGNFASNTMNFMT